MTPRPDVADRLIGCLVAGALGDALGAGVEFDSLSEIRALHGPRGVTGYVPAYGRLGAITDDTQMTLFTAEGLLRAASSSSASGVDAPVEMIRRAYLRWLVTQGDPWLLAPEPGDDGWLLGQSWLHSRRAPGTTCLAGLRGGGVGTPDRPSNDSKGCGGVMRVAPLVVAAEPFGIATDAAALTHGHPSGYLSAGALAAIIAELLRGSALPDAVEAALAQLAARRGHQETTSALRQASS